MGNACSSDANNREDRNDKARNETKKGVKEAKKEQNDEVRIEAKKVVTDVKKELIPLPDAIEDWEGDLKGKFEKFFKPYQKGNIEVSYSEAKKPDKKTYDMLVLGANPWELGQKTLKLTAEERTIANDFKFATFQTTLLKLPAVKEQGMNAVRFLPGRLGKQNGEIYGYRSETRKHFQCLPDDAEYELVTFYQFLDNTTKGNLSQKEMTNMLIDELNSQENKNKEGDKDCWMPYKFSGRQKIKDAEGKETYMVQFHTKYFNRFDYAALKAGRPWEQLRLQGDNNTFNFHASCCFESVLQVYQYMKLVMENVSQFKPEVLPHDRQDTTIAIIGAGPSGLLSARQLLKMGFKGENITIYEQKANQDDRESAMYAGKTHTKVEDQDVKELKEGTSPFVPCELGTCYLSPGYNNMIKELSDLIVDDNKRSPFAKKTHFRGIGTKDQFKEDGPVITLWKKAKTLGPLPPFDEKQSGLEQFPTIMDFNDYSKLKAFEESAMGENDVGELKKKWEGIFTTVALATLGYCWFHLTRFGHRRPIPLQQPQSLKDELGDLSINKFLHKKKWSALIGMLQYGYSVQGYGSTSTNEIPAWYLMIWITPETLLPGVLDEIPEEALKIVQEIPLFGRVVKKLEDYLRVELKHQPIVTCFTKGWGDLWRKQKSLLKEEKVNFVYKADIKKITRKTVDEGTETA